MNRTEWAKTPYAKTDAKSTDQAIGGLLNKYGIEDYQWTQGRGPNGRRAMILRFNFKRKPYRIALEILDAPDVDETERFRQIKRAIFWMLKSALEAGTVFFSPEETMFAFLELPDGSTTWEASAAHVIKMEAKDFGSAVFGRALPPAD